MKKSSDAALETLFLALGDRTRLRLLNLMSGGEVCVCFFVDVLEQPQPKISRHLAYLRSAELVSSRRDGKWVSYAITPPENATAREAFDAVMEAMHDDREFQRDLAALSRACCSPKVSDQLKRAPRPAMAALTD